MSGALDKLRFMLGAWKGRAENQFGEKGVIESEYEVVQDPSDMFVTIRGESRSNGKLVNRAVTIIMFDRNIGKYVRKSAYSYGWISNEVGDWDGDKLVTDFVSIDGEPGFFKGVKWRSYIRKISENEIATGLEVSKNGEPFKLYGESRARRVN